MLIIQSILFYLLSLIYLILPSQTYVEGVIGQPYSFLPPKISNENDKTISKLLYRRLFIYDNFGSLVPDLAEEWIVSDEGLVYTVTIKDNQYWSDGSKINANDLLYTAFKSPNLSGVATDKINDLTVRYTLPNKFSPFLSLLNIGVMKNGSEENYKGFYTPTSGPFRVASVKSEGDVVKRIVLLNTNAEGIKQIAFRFYPNDKDLITAYKIGEIHGFLMPDDAQFEPEAGLTLYRYPVQSVYYALFFNLRRETFKDVTLRNQLSKTLNVEQIIKDHGIPVEGPVSRGYYTSDKYKVSDYDRTASFDMSKIPILIDVADTPDLLDVAKKVKANWEDTLNTSVEIQKHSSEEIRQKVIETRDFDLLLFGQEVGRDPDRYINWHSTQADAPGLNLSGFNSVRADRALEEGRKELDSEIRRTHYDEFQRIVAEQNPAVFLYHPYLNYYISNRIKGVGDKYTFNASDRFLDFNNWTF